MKKRLLSLVFVLSMSTSCNNSGSISITPSAISTPTATATPTSISTAQVSSGPRAAKILFSISQNGSFDNKAGTSNGTVPSPGQGLHISRVFKPDGPLLASQTVDSLGNPLTRTVNWPAWLQSFEVGISGTSNTSAINADCAKFASSNEVFSTNCNLGSGLTSCGAPPNVFRVSEVDCTSGGGAASQGNGGPSDGVYMRAIFNRASTVMGPGENILVVIEYAASSLNPAPADPTLCSSSGVFAPENCSDFTWKAFLKKSASDIVQPFLLLIPPTFSSVLVGGVAKQSGTGPAAKQFIIPLASFPADENPYITLQLSRINSNFGSTDPLTYCTQGGATPGNSPLCAGVIFYSITLYRI